MLSLKTICATISYVPLPWLDVFLDEKKCIRHQGVKYLRFEDIKNPTEENSKFWREVRQLYFSFEKEDWETIRRFYQKYGSILGSDKEPLEEVKKKLNWLRVLTIMVDWAKTEKLAPLWDIFGPPRESKKLEPIYFVGNELELSISFIPWFDPRRSKLVWYTPKNDDQLIQATWQSVVEAITDCLRATPLVPVQNDNISPKTPLILWGFHAKGAFYAAFLQWFFQEVAHMNVTTCKAKGCHNIVLPPRHKFCSDRCKEREKKYRQRHNGKKGGSK